ncbi:hypothetical protein QUF54_07065 [Candidatus Marithioploca araucensis]|uniref:Uncharacterized protein n=1 Tax=Candidatus Marithioploca araucensis TaxID=70273 RepID=A0ABT7VU40_9GAMM|nr:hypothetical protein [Candidatus Marithioploca araucensis]
MPITKKPQVFRQGAFFLPKWLSTKNCVMMPSLGMQEIPFFEKMVFFRSQRLHKRNSTVKRFVFSTLERRMPRR